MSEVKRWTLWMVNESGCELEPYSEESPDGTYIKASDYDQLKAENERLRNSLSEVATRIAHDQRTRKATDSTLDGYLAAGISAADAERDTLRTQLAEARELLERCLGWGPLDWDLACKWCNERDNWLEANHK